MDVIDIGSVLRLHNGSIAVVFGIINAPQVSSDPIYTSLGTFYSVLIKGDIKEIDASQIAEVLLGDGNK
jgi:hypothetical protein